MNLMDEEARLKDPPAQVACTTLLSQSLDNILGKKSYVFTLQGVPLLIFRQQGVP